MDSTRSQGPSRISDTTAEQAASTQSVTSSLDEVAAIGDRTADEAAAVETAVERQDDLVDEVVDRIERFQAQADDLAASLDTFTARTVDDAAPGGDPGRTATAAGVTDGGDPSTDGRGDTPVDDPADDQGGGT